MNLKEAARAIGVHYHRGAVRDHKGVLACIVGVARPLHLHHDEPE